MIWISESKLRNINGIELAVSSHIHCKFVLEALTVVVVVVVVVVAVVRRRRRNIVEVAKLMAYVGGKEDPLTHIVRKHQHNIHHCCRP